MTCAAFDGVLLELVRRALDESAANEAWAHASACEHCRSSLEEQRLLGRRLQMLAEATATSETPPSVKLALRAAFHQQVVRAGSGAPAGRRSRVAGLWLAAAVLVGLALVVGRGTLDRSDPVDVAGGPASLPAAAPSPALGTHATSASATEEPTATRARKVGAAPARARRSRAARVQEQSAIFLPLIPGDRLDDIGSGRLVRVGLSRAALVSWGWPLEGDVAAETVEADLLVGEDGVARAIRVAN